MCTLLERPDATVRPTPQDRTQNTMQALAGQLIHIVEHQAMANIKQRVATIQLWQREVCRIALTRRWAVRGGRTTVPRRSVIDRVAIRVVHVEEKPMGYLLPCRHLERIVVRVNDVAPVAQVAVIVIREATVAGPGPAKVVGDGSGGR